MVALDVGGTTILSGLVTADGTVLHSATRSAVRNGRRDPGLAGTVAAAREMLGAAAERGVAVAGIGAGFPEYVDAAGRLTSAQELEEMLAAEPDAELSAEIQDEVNALGPAIESFRLKSLLSGPDDFRDVQLEIVD